MTRRGRLRVGGRAVAMLLAAFVMLLLGASPAEAHGELERSDPPNNGVVAVGRSAITLWYTEAITAGASAFELRTSDGEPVALTTSVSETDEGGGIVEITTPPLARASYRLDWRVLSTDDGHSSTGSLLFGVGTRPEGVASAEGVDLDTPALLLRWIDLSAIMLMIGALAVSGHVFGSMGEVGRAPRRRSISLAALAAGVAVLTGAITPFILTRGGSSFGLWFDVTWATLIGTPWGHLWLARELALVIAAGALLWATRSGRARRGLQIAAVAVLAVVLLESWAGHASTLPSRSVLAALASASHLVAAGVWAGGLTILAICLIPLMRHYRGLRRPILTSAWRAFSPMAAIATVVLLATGLYEAGRYITDLSFVASTVYGGTVVVKLVLIAVALTLAGINTLFVNPRLAARVGRILGRPVGEWAPFALRRFPIVVAAEILILVVAVGAAGLLTSVPTAREIAAATKQTELHTATVDGLFVTFELLSSGPDQSRLIVRSHSTVKVEQAPVSAVSVTLSGPEGETRTVLLERIEAGRYEAETAQPTPGAWEAALALKRGGLPDAVTQVGWTVSAARPEGASSLEVVTSALAVLLLAATLGAVGFARRRKPAGSQATLPPVLEMSEARGRGR